MSSPLHVWPEVPELARRRFSFSPAIRGIEPNEWTLRRVSVDEAVVHNVATQEEISVPRRYMGDVSRLEETVRVVTLLKRLEFCEGVVRPVNRGVVEMPPASDMPRVRPAHPATVVSIREELAPTRRWWHYLRILAALGCLACFIAVYVFREGRSARVRRFSARPSRLVPHPPATAPPVPLQKR
jgi:hypothetical protein